MPSLWLYRSISRFRWLNYRGKILLMAFVGTHVPLLALIGYFIVTQRAGTATALVEIAVALAATLLGTGITLFVLDHLLRPVIATSRALRLYRRDRVLSDLPTDYDDEVGTLMADASETLIELDDAIDKLSNYDRVTRLPNRNALLREIATRLDAQRPFFVCATRLNDYDRLVATFDQATVDTLMRRLARSIVKAAAGRAFIARIESGVFGSVFEADVDVEGLTRIIDAALTELGREIVIGDLTLMPDLSAGVAAAPQDGSDPVALVDNAIAALTPRTDEETPVRFFTPAIREAARQRFLTEQDLRRALNGSELRLHYQPVVDLGLGRTVGAEALVRWQHPDRGLLMPGSFIPIAESSGLIDPMGHWVLEAATEQLGAWAAAGREDLKVAINLSARQFHDPDLIDAITKAVRDNNLAPGRLEVELTETAAMADRDRAAMLFARLRDAGVSIAIDDFGTGYSSMVNLLDLPFDVLKIDRRFVTGIDNRKKAHAICTALIALSRDLKTEVLAEGVETREELAQLVAMGVRRFQGFYFAKALPADDFFRTANDLGLTRRTMSGELLDASGAPLRKTG